MSFRGRGRGRGRGGFGGGGYRFSKQEPVELFPEIECLGVVKYTNDEIKKYARFVSWSRSLQTSIYKYEDRSKRLATDELKLDIQRYEDKISQAKQSKTQLWDIIKTDADHMPAELVLKGAKRVAKKVKWDNELKSNKLDVFEKLEEKQKGQEGDVKKENEEEEEEEELEVEDEGEYSDEGDYEQAEAFDDDEDDFNMAEEVDEAEY